jgi:light-harvesting complex I chlorophyll a/b binding protein 1
MKVADMIGVSAEISGVFDPFGFATNADEATLRKYRASELKHGRVAMLAVVGNLMGSLYHFPGDLNPGKLKFADVPAGIHAGEVVPLLGWLQVLAFCGALEFGPFKQEANRAPGDVAKFSWWTRYDDKDADAKLQLQELKNGRLAMIAIMGEIAHELVTGQTVVGQIQAGNFNPFHL